MATSCTDLTTLAGGCFWCLEAVFQKVPGIIQITNGYSGGHVPNPTYQQVCSDTTGHAEAVQLRFNPDIIDYSKILEIFFSIHDPTTINRQGFDVGHSYRSAIFYYSPEQEAVARGMVSDLSNSKAWTDPIVTEILPSTDFYQAEVYHQNYFVNNPTQPYCRAIIEPKLRKFLGMAATPDESSDSRQ